MSAERTRQINALFKELEKAITAQIDAAQEEERRAAARAKREAREKS
jgi:hypothetical protein